MDERSEVLFIGGRAGVGKSSVAFELHEHLYAAQIKHCVIEGDTLDLAYPRPWEHGLAEKNLADMWRNYRALGYRRLIYTNTVSVLETEGLAAAMGDDPTVKAVLLRASDATAAARLERTGERKRRSSFTSPEVVSGRRSSSKKRRLGSGGLIPMAKTFRAWQARF